MQCYKILQVLQLWSQMETYSREDSDWLCHEALQVRIGICDLATESDLGIPMPTPGVRESARAWHTWAEGHGDTTGTTSFLKAWAASENILMVRTIILCPQNNANGSYRLPETRRSNLDTALLS